MTEAQLLSDFPDLPPEDIRASLAFAAARERRVSSLNQGGRGVRSPLDQLGVPHERGRP